LIVHYCYGTNSLNLCVTASQNGRLQAIVISVMLGGFCMQFDNELLDVISGGNVLL